MATARPTDFLFNLAKWLHGGSEMGAHKATGWRLYRMDPGENVPVHKDRRTATPTGGKLELHSTHASAVIGANGRQAGPPSVGSYFGVVIQNGKPNTSRGLMWGYAEWGQHYQAKIPQPASGTYLIEGYPAGGSDRHCTIYDPTTRLVHEMIQLDPNWGTALGWGAWKDGVLVDGRPVTAGGNVNPDIAAHKLVWTPWSSKLPHRVGFTTHDYYGYDGMLPAGGIEVGGVYLLDRGSESYRRMVAKGGECAAIAEAFATRGGACYDRSGYGKDGRPLASKIAVQVASQFLATNVHEFSVAFTDLIPAS